MLAISDTLAFLLRGRGGWLTWVRRRNIALDRPARRIILIATYRGTSGSDLTVITRARLGQLPW